MVGLPGSFARRAAVATTLFLGAVALVVAWSSGARLERADFVFTNGGEVRSLDPHAVSGVPEGRIVSALFEGLLTRDPRTALVRPGVATHWEIAPGGLVYTFHLRPANWSNGDPLTADDFAWSFRRLLEPETAADYAAQLWNVEGARAYATGVDESGASVARDWSRVGIRALDAATLEIRLVHPQRTLLEVMALPALCPVHRASLEALRARYPSTWSIEWTKPEHLVCNGPFRLLERRLNDRLRLVKNERYWDAEHVALRTLDALAVESPSAALNLYLSGAVDWVDGALPTAVLPELQRREDFISAPYLGLYFYRVNVTRPPLDQPLVRIALSQAIDRKAICEKLLGAGQRPELSLVPWGGIGGYRSQQSAEENAANAAGILRSLGFGAEGKPFPPLEIHYNSSEIHRDIAECIAERWRSVLGIEVRLRNQEWKAFLDAQSNLDFDVSRSSWIADFQDPSSFFEVFTSDSENNRTGWKHGTYDQLVREASTELDNDKRFALWQRAEKLFVDALPILPIYGYVSQHLIDPRVGGFHGNPLNVVAFKELFWRDDAELAEARKLFPSRRKPVESHGPRAGLHAPASAPR